MMAAAKNFKVEMVSNRDLAASSAAPFEWPDRQRESMKLPGGYEYVSPIESPTGSTRRPFHLRLNVPHFF
jgi:hypothetical protein